MNEQTLIAVLLLAPLVGFLINGFRVRKHNHIVAGSIATIAVVTSFICSIILFFNLTELGPEKRTITANFFNWLSIGNFKADFSFVVDQISGIMILIITGVGSLIHLFSIEYMHHDKGVAKYFAYLNLFVFNMLLLVLGGNLLVMFTGWEGVGLCSYLLIGFWFTDDAKAAAGMKAFVTNRVGDAAFILGMFLLFLQFGTIEFSSLNGMAPATPTTDWMNPLTVACLLLFVGATGKSAQIPLFVWLPDAMAGPTPVSALIATIRG
jgi:NADH-quinone oxidoreductase subunit L